MKAVGATAIFGVGPMVETLKEVARLCPSIRKVIVLGAPQEGTVSFQEMAADSGDLFNDNLDVSDITFNSITLFLNESTYLNRSTSRTTCSSCRTRAARPVSCQ